MTRRVWFISDTHFGHANIIKYARHQFSSVEEMDECLIDAWCSTVGRGDLVYHLGDFAWDSKKAHEYRSRLTGTIRLIVGNHDDIRVLTESKIFQRIHMWRQFPEYGFHATHVPMRGQQIRHAKFNVHGHVHANTEGLDPWHKDVSVESLADFKPISAEELRQWTVDNARDGYES